MTRITVDTNDPWWLQLAQVTSGFAALAAAGVAAYGIVQGRRLEADRKRARESEYLATKIHVLDEALDHLKSLEVAARRNDAVAVAHLQRDLRARAAAKSSHDITIVTRYTFHGRGKVMS